MQQDSYVLFWHPVQPEGHFKVIYQPPDDKSKCCCCCCCSFSQLNTLGVGRYIWNCTLTNAFHKVRIKSACLFFSLFFYPATLTAARRLQRIDFHFWRVDAVMQGVKSCLRIGLTLLFISLSGGWKLLFKGLITSEGCLHLTVMQLVTTC